MPRNRYKIMLRGYFLFFFGVEKYITHSLTHSVTHSPICICILVKDKEGPGQHIKLVA